MFLSIKKTIKGRATSMKSKILLVEDDKTTLAFIRAKLVKEGFEVKSAENGQNAIDLMAGYTPDLIISDIIMPVMDGMEFRNSLRENQKFNLIPFVFISAKDELDDKILGFEIGADYYLTKPFEENELIAIINSRIEKSREFNNLIYHDKLTGLLNRGGIDKRIEEEIHRGKRYNNSFSIAMMDIDHFKKVNDTYGHQAGDLVLKNVSEHIAKTIRDSDYAGRYGGEEFLIVMPYTDKENAFIAAERIRGSLADMGIKNTGIKITISGGIASYPEDGDVYGEIVSSADSALYSAKNNGRNCVVSCENQ
jgi:diguanylate cyclase (GGDEF)-like protein